MVHVEESRAVETYLLNFRDGKAHCQELLEVTLYYGMQCLSRSVSLTGMSCHELRTITGYDAAKTRDFHACNASQAMDKKGGKRPLDVLRTKPSHAWRDGEAEMPDFSTPSAVAEAALQSTGESKTEKGALHSLSPSFDEIEYLTKLLGKSLVELTWKIFAERRGLPITTREELDEQFFRVDQNRTATLIPPLQLPATSVAEFLGMYVTECVRQAQQTGSADNNKRGSRQESNYADRDVRLDSVSNSHAARDNTKSVDFSQVDTEQKQRHLLPQPRQRQSQQGSRLFHRVQSQSQPELQTQQQKTQPQRMVEARARVGLAEYEARCKLQDLRDGRLDLKTISISDITTGAAALKIVDNFIKSPLMNKFGRGHMSVSGRATPLATNPIQSRSGQKDYLEEEVCGTPAFENSFCGCKSKRRLRSESQPRQRRRKYDGWLNDFGPLHPKIVRPKWNEDNAAEPDARARGIKFEWNFEDLPSENYENNDCLKAQTSFNGTVSDKGPTQEFNDFDDGLDDARSETSDPVFRWLEDAV